MARKPERYPSVRPDAPPSPEEVDQAGPEPMAVAGDKRTVHDAFMPTTSSKNVMNRELADRYATPIKQAESDEDQPGGRLASNKHPLSLEDDEDETRSSTD